MSLEVLEILKQSKLFSRFSGNQLEEVILHMNPKLVTLKSTERLYTKGDKADCCWLIVSGKLTLKRASLRSPFRSMVFHKGSVTGIQGLVNPDSTRVVGMIADGKVKLIEITHEGIAHLNQDTQILLWENVSKILLRKLSICLSRDHLTTDTGVGTLYRLLLLIRGLPNAAQPTETDRRRPVLATSTHSNLTSQGA